MVTGSIAGAAATQAADLSAPIAQAAPYPPSAPDALILNQLAITPPNAFFKQHYRPRHTPQIARSDWRLQVEGLSDTPQVLRWGDIQNLPQQEALVTLECAGNADGGHLIGTALWRGFSLEALLARLPYPTQAEWIIFTGADGYQTALHLATLRETGAFLAHSMNDAPLPPEHGYPLRLIVPSRYGYKMPKWIVGLSFVDYPFMGFWESRGWSDEARINPHAIIISPKHNQKMRGTIRLQGFASPSPNFGGVALRIDGGAWLQADLLPVLDKNQAGVWHSWELVWQPPQAGRYLIEACAFGSETHFFENEGDSLSERVHKIIVEVGA